jgi:rhodanese-related sulfurtransferase
MKTVRLSNAIQEINEGKTLIIDVREPLEFQSKKIDGAINMPSSNFDLERIQSFKEKKLVIICESGGRANMVYNLLKEKGLENIFVSDKHMAHVELHKKEHQALSTISWTVDRQFRMTLGVLLVIFLLGFHFVSPYFIIIPVILATGLVVTSIINKCYMKIGIAMLPWNTNQEYKD